MVNCETPEFFLNGSVNTPSTRWGLYHAQELSHHETGGTSSDQEGVGASLGGDLLQSVHGARCGLDEGSINIAEVVDLEELALGVVALDDLRESSINAVKDEFLTYSAKPPSRFKTPWAEKSSQSSSSPLRQ